MVQKEIIVKSRFHHGSTTLDLTIPSDIVKTLEINPGDFFRLTTKEEKGNLILQYERVYKTKA